jgi:hypothetical protein
MIFFEFGKFGRAKIMKPTPLEVLALIVICLGIAAFFSFSR